MKQLVSDISVKFVSQGGRGLLSFQRRMDGARLDLAMARFEERAVQLKERWPRILDPFRQHVGRVRMHLDETEALRAVSHLDRLAYGLIDQMAEDSPFTAGEILSQLSAFFRPVFTFGDQKDCPLIEIETSLGNDSPWDIPFEFLPLAPPNNVGSGGRAAMERFLGFRAQIVRLMRGGPLELRALRQGGPQVKLLAYTGSDLPGIVRQIAFLNEGGHIGRRWPGKLKAADLFLGATEMAKELLSRSPAVSPEMLGEIIHLSCHYRAAGLGMEDEPGLEFGTFDDGRALIIRLFDLRAELARLHSVGNAAHPATVVFLNACNSAQISLKTDSLLALFVRRKALAVIGSETWLPDNIAAEFAIGFYGLFFRGIRLGQSIVGARRRLLEHYANPGGLFYCLFGNPLIEVRGTM